MKCYKIRDTLTGKQYTADLAPKLTHDFQLEPGDTIIGGTLQKGCRIRMPAKLFCIEVEPRTPTTRTRRTRRRSGPSTVPSPASASATSSRARRCPSRSCRSSTRSARGRSGSWDARPDFCTSVTRQQPQNAECSLAGNGQCGGTCPTGETCLATSPADCGCVPTAQACASSTTCGAGFCGGVWETCVLAADRRLRL
jgi:hypothetical protein